MQMGRKLQQRQSPLHTGFGDGAAGTILFESITARYITRLATIIHLAAYWRHAEILREQCNLLFTQPRVVAFKEGLSDEGQVHSLSG